MAHHKQLGFFQLIREIQPRFFKNTKVLDIGSLNINGSVKPLFNNCEYIGLDLGAGENVDVVCKAHEYDAPDGHFDVIVSGECFEHDMYIELTLKNIVRMLKPDGLFMFSCANKNRAEHGTARTDPKASPFTTQIPEWENYYRGLDENDFRHMLDIDSIFPHHFFKSMEEDLYFYGIKKACGVITMIF